MLLDIDGDPHSYHVEFLGTPHSHSWVAAKCVAVYGHKTLPAQEDSQSQAVVSRGQVIQQTFIFSMSQGEKHVHPTRRSNPGTVSLTG